MQKVDSDSLQDWKLLPTKPNWAEGFSSAWQPGEKGAQQQWQSFLQDKAVCYKDGRGLSRTKEPLHTSRRIWHLARSALTNCGLIYSKPWLIVK